MRDALRAVGLVIGVLLLFVGASGLLRAKMDRPEIIAAAVGAAFLVLVAIIPPGQRPPPVYDDEW